MILSPVPLDDFITKYPLPGPGDTLRDTDAMLAAYQIAWRGLGHVRSNPLVGCVILDSAGRYLLGEAHRAFGGPHAEVAAVETLRSRGQESELKGASLYVTLEPCAHHGKTPPCAEFLAALPIKKVVYACKDPNPLVSGKGVELLKSRGIEVIHLREMAPLCEELLQSFIWFLKERTPYVGLKAALNLDGSYSKTTPGNQPVTCERSRAYGHFLRGLYDGIVIGAQSVITDNPTLNMRRADFACRTPLRIVLDPRARALKARRIEETNLCTVDPDKTLWCVAEGVIEQLPQDLRRNLDERGVRLRELTPVTGTREFRLKKFLHELGQGDGISSLLLEGGLGVWKSFLEQDLVHRIHLFQAPVIWGREGKTWLDTLNLKESIQLHNPRVTTLGSDLLMEGYLRPESRMRSL